MAHSQRVRQTSVVHATGTSKSLSFVEGTALDSTYLLVCVVTLQSSTVIATPSGWSEVAGGSTGVNQTRTWIKQGDGTTNGITYTTVNSVGTTTIAGYAGFSSLTPLVTYVSNPFATATATWSVADPTSATGFGAVVYGVTASATVVGETHTNNTLVTNIDGPNTSAFGFAMDAEYQDGTGSQATVITMPGTRIGRVNVVVLPLTPITAGYTATGGVTLSGVGQVGGAAAGGFTLGGSGAASLAYARTAGYLDASWPPEWQAAWGGIPQGVTIGGSATSSLAYTRSGAGGFTLSGTAPASVSYPRTAADSLTLSGSTTSDLSYTRTATGGMALSGSATAIGNYPTTATGGVVLSGSTVASIAYPRTAAGGFTLGGSADSGTSIPRTATGGIVLGGTATASLVITATATGGFTLGGTASTGTSFPSTAAGGFTLGGSTAASVGYPRTATGTITLGGSAVASASYPSTAVGGVTLGGIGTAGTNYFATGGITLGGTAVASVAFTRTATGILHLAGVGQLAAGPAPWPRVGKLTGVAINHTLRSRQGIS